jgi:hypothetical protein
MLGSRVCQIFHYYSGEMADDIFIQDCLWYNRCLPHVIRFAIAFPSKDYIVGKSYIDKHATCMQLSEI